MSSGIRLGAGKFLSVGRYRIRKGLPPAPSMSGPLTDEPDWSYPDGTPGLMTKGQTMRYMRDQEFGKTMVKFNEQFTAIRAKRQNGNRTGQDLETNQSNNAKQPQLHE